MRAKNGFSQFLAALAAAAALPVCAGAPAAAAGPAPARHAGAGGALAYFGNPGGRAHVPAAARAVAAGRPDHVIGTGTPAACTSAAVLAAVAAGGVITFNCGPSPVTITLTAAAKVTNTAHMVVLDGGGLVTLSGGGRHRILYLDTCDRRQGVTTGHCYDQRWPYLVVQNITLADGYSGTPQTPGVPFGGGGGGAIFDLGGQLKVVNSRFTGNRCYPAGPDLGGGAIRALSQWHGLPVYITYDTFTGGRCSNGGALSSIGVSWHVFNSVLAGNQAVGFGANPPLPGTPGGGSGGAIYTDGGTYRLVVQGTRFTGNYAREGGGAIFFVSNDHTGGMVIRNSALDNNPSGVFWTRLYPGIYFHCLGHHPRVVNSTFR